MQSTNVNPPANSPVTSAQTVPGTTQTELTSETYSSGQRTIAVNATQGQVSLRYAPINPKSPPQSTK